MQYLFLFKPDFALFDPDVVERALKSCDQFSDWRFNEPGGARFECQYIEPNDWTIVHLDGDARAISTSNTGDAALRAVLLIQQALGVPLRLVDDDNSFDFVFCELSGVEEIVASMRLGCTR